MEGSLTSADSNNLRERKRTWYCLVIVVSVFTAVIFVMTSIRYMSFLALNWDLGINMQMLWTTTHGYLLFESADHQTSGVMSFLQVNPVYIALPIAYLYRLMPNAYTLLFLQALVLSLSSVPIYFYTHARVNSEKISLLVAIIFLSNFAVMSGIFYDYHWETFMPLEFFGFIYLFSTRRYVFSGIALLLGSLTLQVFPFLAASYLLYVLLFPAEIHREDRNPAPTAHRTRMKALFLLVSAAVMYFVISYSGDHWIPALIGAQKAATATATNSISMLLNVGVTPTTIIGSLLYWGLMFAVLGFIPLLRTRSLLVIVPWFYFSVIAYPQHYSSQFGLQYGILAMAVLLVPFIEGVRKLKNEDAESYGYGKYVVVVGGLSLIVVPIIYGTISAFYDMLHLIEFIVVLTILVAVVYLLFKRNLTNSKHLPMIRIRITGSKDVTFYLLFILLVGLLIGPLNPQNTGPPFTGGYAVSFSPSSSYQYMNEITALVGHNSTVLSTDNLFPFVANDPNAYSFYWYLTNYSENQYFPFGSGHLPEFLLFSSAEMNTVPPYFSNQAMNSSNYGLRIAILNPNYPDDIYLYEKEYTGVISTHYI